MPLIRIRNSVGLLNTTVEDNPGAMAPSTRSTADRSQVADCAYIPWRISNTWVVAGCKIKAGTGYKVLMGQPVPKLFENNRAKVLQDLEFQTVKQLLANQP